MKGPLRAAALGLVLALGGCDKPDPVSVAELTTFTVSNPDCKKMDVEQLKGILATLEAAQQYRTAAGDKDQFLDLRDPAEIERYSNNPIYKDFPYEKSARLIEQGVLFGSFEPWLEVINRESPTRGILMHDELYTLVVDEASGRKVLKIEQGNLLRPGEKDSNASFTTLIDVETGIVTALDDGTGPFNDQGFELGHDEKGKVVAKKERGSHWNNDRLDAILSSAVTEIGTLGRKLEEERAELEGTCLQVHDRIQHIGE